MTDNQYKEVTVLKRLVNIQKIHDAVMRKENTSKFSNKDKITYILWRNASSRNSDINLSIEFYKKFFPEYVKDDMIRLDDLYLIPKMYDIQRTRAEIQNTEGLFPAIDEVRKARLKCRTKRTSEYRENKRKTLRVFSDYYLYLDESGKNEKYFVLAGLLLNSKSVNDSQRMRFNTLKKTLNRKHGLNIQEFKFGEIKQRNLNYYKDLVDIIFKEGIPAVFVSILVENKGLKQKTERNKSNELLELLLRERLASLILRATCSSPYASSKAKVNVIRDIDLGYDSVEREKIRQDIDDELKKSYTHLIKIESIKDVDSKDDVLVQLSDLYASSINNVFSEQPENSETAKCKKEFAKYFLKKVGLEEITQELSSKESDVKFINKVI